MKSPTFPDVSYAEWRRRVESELGEDGFERFLVDHADGVDLEALCTAEHPEGFVGMPISSISQVHPPDRPFWIACQQFEEIAPENLNHHLKSDLSNGVAGIWLRLDRAARQGEDPTGSDSVGVEGTAVYSLEDWLDAFEETPSDWRVLLLDGGGCFLPAAAIFAAWRQRTGFDIGSKTVLFGADPLGTLAHDGRVPASLAELSDDMAVLIQHSQEMGAGTRALAINTQPYREAGAEIDQELALSLSTGAEYFRWMEERGLEPDQVAPEVAFVTGTGQQIFLEIAKLRALRLLWRHFLRACDVPASVSPWIHASVLRRSLPTREPSINLLRVTTATFAAALGGADSIEAPAYDWFRGEGTSDRGDRLARNTQLILALESHLGRVRDPSAGSYFLETVTQELVARGWARFQEIERQGGLSKALSSGWVHRAIDRRWEVRHSEVENGEIPLTGVNRFTDPNSVYEEADQSEISAAKEAIRWRCARQKASSQPGSTAAGPVAEDRWNWCWNAALENRPIGEMSSALYSTDQGPVVESFPRRRDSQPCEEAVDS